MGAGGLSPPCPPHFNYCNQLYHDTEFVVVVVGSVH